jgi:hypothetical protein
MNGPIEDMPLPKSLLAHVVDGVDQPRMHGYDVQQDLARHYRFSELLFLALTGDLPDEDAARALDVALVFASPAFAGDASTHAAIVSRVCGPRASSVFSVAATATAEHVRTILDRHETILARLAIGALNGSAVKYAPRDAQEEQSVQRLRTALGAFCAKVPAIGYNIGLETAIIATLTACGLRNRDQLEVVLSSARMPAACAEALAWKPGDLRAYPMDLPSFLYQKDFERDSDADA